MLQSILQTEKKTVVYSHAPVAVQQEFPEATVLSYGENLPAGTRTLVFYDAGAEKFLQEGQFPLLPEQTGRLVLLYDRDELVAQRQALRNQYPDIAGLRCCYAAIREKLRLMGVCPEKDLVDTKTREGYILSKQVLQIFYGLQMFFCHEGLVSLGETGKKRYSGVRCLPGTAGGLYESSKIAQSHLADSARRNCRLVAAKEVRYIGTTGR